MLMFFRMFKSWRNILDDMFALSQSGEELLLEDGSNFLLQKRAEEFILLENGDELFSENSENLIIEG